MTERFGHGVWRLVAWLALAVLIGTPMPGRTAQTTGIHEAFRASFVQTRTQPGFPQPLVSHGTLSVSPEHGFTWEITRPYHYRFSMDQDGTREVLPDGTQRTLHAADAPWLTAVRQIFVAALSGDRARLARYFTVSVAPASGEHGRHLVLTPKTGALAKVIRRITVTERSPGRPQRLHVDEVSGATMDVRFSPPAAAPR